MATRGPDPEFEDEPPGTYLLELEAGPANVVWSLINLVLLASVAAVWFASTLTPESSWWTLCRLAWILAPVSSAFSLIVTFWQSRVSRPPRWRLAVPVSLWLSVLALLVWFVGSRLGVDFSGAEDAALPR